VLGLRRPGFADLGILATTATLALLANAVVCGVFANPHDRYGARLVWLAPFIVLVAAWRLYAERGRLSARWHAGARPLPAGLPPPA
jgi:hypothetical protein